MSESTINLEELTSRLLKAEETITSFQTQADEDKQRIKQLEEANQQLFLKATATPGVEDTQPEKWVSKLLGDEELHQHFTPNQLKHLKEIEEEIFNGNTD